MFLNTLTYKIQANCKIIYFFCSVIINLLFEGLAYNTSGHFAHCSYFSWPLRGSEKYYATRKISARVLYAKPSNKVYIITMIIVVAMIIECLPLLKVNAFMITVRKKTSIILFLLDREAIR